VTPKSARVFFSGKQHKRHLEEPHNNTSTMLTYPSPEKLVKYLAGSGLSTQPQKSLPNGKRKDAKEVFHVEQESQKKKWQVPREYLGRLNVMYRENRPNTCEASESENRTAASKSRSALL